MRNKSTLLFLAGILFFSCSKSPIDCQTGETQATERNVKLSFSASFVSETSSKTVLGEGGKVLWEASESISLFYGSGDNGGNKFVSVNESTTSKTSFQGNITVISTGIEEEIEQLSFMAIYPYSGKNSCDGINLTANVSDSLTALASSFPAEKMISVAKSSGLSLAFYNVCGGIKFSVQEEGIVKIVLEGNNNETLAGDATISFGEDGKPYVSAVANPKQKLHFYSPSPDGFVPGKSYYLPFLPTKFSSGMTFTLIKNNEKAVKTYSGAAVIERSAFGAISQLDKNVVFESWENPEAETDPTRIVLHYYAPDENTSVSYSYAPGGSYRPGEWITELIIDGNTVTPGTPYNLGKAGDHKVMMNFIDNEIPNAFFRNVFSKAPYLTSVSIPEGYTYLPMECFNGCTALKNVYLPESLQKIHDLCFNNCSCLETLKVPDKLNYITYNAFWGCDNLKSFIGNKVLDNGHLLVDSDNGPIAFAPCGYEWPMISTALYGKLKSYTPPTGIYSEYIPYGTEYKYFANDYKGNGNILSNASPTLVWLAVPNPEAQFDNYLQDYTSLKYLCLNCKYYPYSGITNNKNSAVLGNLIFCCDELLVVDFGPGVRKISNCCVNCKKLLKINFSEGLTYVGGRSFVNLPSLVEIRFPDSMQTIGEWCLTQTEALKRVYFGKSLGYLGEGLFYTLGLWDCVLEDVYFASTTPPAGYVPTAIPETCRIHVPAESVDEYKNTWEPLANQIEAYDFGEEYFVFK